MANELTNTGNVISEVAENTVASSSAFGKYLPIAGGFLGGLLVGAAIDHFVINPIMKKVAGKKAEKEVKEVKDTKPEKEES